MNNETKSYCQECGEELDKNINPAAAGRDGWRLRFCDDLCRLRYNNAQLSRADRYLVGSFALFTFLPVVVLIIVIIIAVFDKLK